MNLPALTSGMDSRFGHDHPPVAARSGCPTLAYFPLAAA